MKRKITKKILLISLKVLLVFIALDLLLVLLVFTPPVQKILINKVTASLEDLTKSNFSIRKIYITPLLKIKASDVAIQDHHGNNMISVKKLAGRLNFPKSSVSAIYLRNIVIEDAEFIIRQYSGEKVTNLNIWVHPFQNDKPKSNFIFCLEDAQIMNSRFAVVFDDKRAYREDKTIDYGFFELKNINGKIENFKLEGAEVTCKINQVSLEQYTGFRIKNFSGDFSINKNALIISHCNLISDRSKADLDFAMRYMGYSDFSQFFDKIKFDVDVKSSAIHMDDLACFVPGIQGMHNSILFTGKGDGPLNALQLTNCYAKYKLTTFITGDFSIFNLVDIKNSSYDIHLKNSSLNLSEMTDFYLPGGTTIGLPESISKLGSASITGNFEGSFNYFKTDLNLISTIGNAKIFLLTEPYNGKMSFKGKISTPNFQLGKLIQNSSYLGKIVGDVNFEGSAEPFMGNRPFAPSIVAKIDAYTSQFDLCSYPINNMELHGNYEQNLYIAQISSSDPNINFNLDGAIDVREVIPRYKVNLELSDLVLGTIFKNFQHVIGTANPKGIDNVILFAKQRPELRISCNNLEAEVKGNTLQDFTGFIAANNILVSEHEETAVFEWLRLNSIVLPGDVRNIMLKGSIFNANLTTNYKLEELLDSLKGIASYYLPSLFTGLEPVAITQLDGEKENPHFLSISLETFDTRKFLQFFLPGLRLAQHSTLNLYIGPERKMDTISVQVSRIRWKDFYSARALSIRGRIDAQEIFNLSLHADSLIYYQKKSPLVFRNINLVTQSENQNINYHFSWVSPDTLNLHNTSFIKGFADISNTHNVLLKLQEANLYLRNSMWVVNGLNELHFKKHRIEVDDFILKSNLGIVDIRGVYSGIYDESLDIRVENFDVSLINALTSRINIELGGKMSALLTYQTHDSVSTVVGKSYFENFVFNKEELGTLFVFAEAPLKSSPKFHGGLFLQDPLQKLGGIEQYNFFNYSKGRVKLADIMGIYDTDLKELRIKGILDSIRIGFLSPFLASFSNHVSGHASGELSFVANSDSLYFDGIVNVKEGFLGIAPLNTIYKIKDQIITFNSEGIIFDKVAILDKYNNKATVDGYIHHQSFKNMNINLLIQTPKILAMSTIKKTDSFFYGDAFASGAVTIFGNSERLSFRGDNLRSLPGTKMGFPISYASTSYEDRGIVFVSVPDPSKKNIDTPSESTFEMDFDFIFDINKDADVRIDLEPVDGILDCKTSGRVRLTYNSKSGLLNMDGKLDILSGDFSMSIKNVLPRTFELIEGGSINFLGPIKSSTIFLTALHERTASMKDLSPDIEVNKTQVNAYLTLSGDLMNPQPSFSFGFPKLTSEEELQVFSILDTTDQQNNLLQFFSLVYLGTFYSTTATLNDVSPLGTSIDLMARTFSNMLLQEIKFADIGVNVLSSNQYFKEYSVNTAIPLYKDRIVVKTRFGYAESLSQEVASSNFIGDVSMEYLINEEGNWRLKLFYFNDQTNLNNMYQNFSRPTQGGGIALIYQQEFFRRKGLVEYQLDRKSILKQPIK